MESLSNVTASVPEPPPVVGENPISVTNELKSWIQVRYSKEDDTPLRNRLLRLVEERRLFGLQKYGTELTLFNGRNMARDAKDEIADAIVYLFGAWMEGKLVTNDSILAELASYLPVLTELLSK